MSSPDPSGLFPLHLASKEGRNEAVAEFLMSSDLGEVNSMTTSGGRSPLFLAATQGHADVTETLLRLGQADPNACVETGMSPLNIAAAKGHGDVARVLLGAKNTDPNLANLDGKTPLASAAYSGHSAIVSQLVSRQDVDVNKATVSAGLTPLLYAVREGDEAAVAALMKRADLDVNAMTLSGEAPIHKAVMSPRSKILRMLLKSPEIDVNVVSRKSGLPPLLMAARGGAAYNIKSLRCDPADSLKALLDVPDLRLNVVDRRELDVVRTCLYGGHVAALQVLLAHPRVKVRHIDLAVESWQCKEIVKAWQHKKVGAVEQILLAQPEANVNDVATEGRKTALILASAAGLLEVVCALLARDNVDVNAKDATGTTALLAAVRMEHHVVVDLLLGVKGVDVETGNVFGNTPLLAARRKENSRLVKLLLVAGANIYEPVRTLTPGTKSNSISK